MRFLAPLLELIYPPRATERLVRLASAESLAALVAPRAVWIGDLRATALLPYRTPLVRALVLEAKFRGSRRAQELLGGVLAEHLSRTLEQEERECRVIPIPLSARRQKERGYNQVEEIAKAGCRRLIQSGLLWRTADTRPQTELGRDAREANMAGAFMARDLDPAYLYILVDDVLTTGATLSAAAQALRSAGARHIWLVSLAH